MLLVERGARETLPAIPPRGGGAFFFLFFARRKQIKTFLASNKAGEMRGAGERDGEKGEPIALFEA